MATTKIKDPVEGIIDLDRLPAVPVEAVRRLVDSPELQRLRQVKQLGFSELVYPGATHTRFAHSLGAFQGAQRTMRQMQAGGAEIPDPWFTATAVACLLHDLGHGPFSHAFEAVMGHRHEDWTRRLVQDGVTVPARLEALGPGTQDRVLQLLGGAVREPGLRWLADLVSSALDCDRMDYLRRDSLHTGTHYGSFDRDWLVRAMVPSPDGEAVILVEKGCSAVEQYLIGRYHMFQNVYLHKTSRGFETAFGGLCRRLRRLGPDATPPGACVLPLLHESTLDRERFLGLTDNHFQVDFGLLLDHEDATVRALARALRLRRPLRCLTTGGPPEALDDEAARRREEAAAAGLDPVDAVWVDEAEDVPYHPYAPEQARKGLRVRVGGGEPVDITELSPTLRALAQPVVVHRLYWIEASAARK
jgi:HD superfamily phosphohydrolase